MGKLFDPSIGKRTQFKPGQSGNPGGRPGYRVRAERLLEKSATDKDVRAVLATIIDRAKAGEPWACEMLLRRILPPTERREVETLEAAPVEELESALARIAERFADEEQPAS